MGIPDEDVARVRAATDIVALIGEHAALKRQGRRWVGLCPFHGEKTPSFSVNAEEGFYYCFGCQEKGDAITFVRKTEHLDFVDAVRRLADKSGIVIHEDANAGRDSQRRKVFTDAMEQATEWYHQRLLTGPDAGLARDYLRSRGYDGDVVRRFRMGWAPDDWDALCSALKLNNDLAVGSGLGFVNRRGRLQDAFRARILFPICDPSGHPVAFGGRVLPGSPDPAKYKNSSESPIYSKRRILYALNWAKADIIKTGEVVVCEGYTDVVGSFVAGVERAVATCGTALGDDHFRLLRNFAKRVVLAFDADGAGQSAAGRFYEWERRHEVDVVVANLPAGADPADLASSDPEAFRAAIADAKPFLQFRVERVLAAADLSTPEGRAKAADAALTAVAEHPDDLVRDQYVMQVAEKTRMEPAPLRDRLERLRQEGPKPEPEKRGSRGSSGAASRPPGPPPTNGTDGEPCIRDPDDEGWDGDGELGSGANPGRNGATNGPGPAGDGSFRPGLEALRLAIHRPEEVAHRLEAALFSDGLQRTAFEVLMTSDDLHQAIDTSVPAVRALLVRLTVEEPTGEPDEVVSQLVRDAVRRQLALATREARTSPEAAAEAAAASVWVQELDDPAAAAMASARLVAWLVVKDDNGVSQVTLDG
ncbi:MAG TPA: DNA primase [Acidimicrobiales bacterium]|jgi:DNA primase|nr:DNA primase [Acidimicrobiales bacterium]